MSCLDNHAYQRCYHGSEDQPETNCQSLSSLSEYLGILIQTVIERTMAMHQATKNINNGYTIPHCLLSLNKEPNPSHHQKDIHK
jgi:hypothetical protein